MLSSACVHVCRLSGVEMLSGGLIGCNCVYGALRQRLVDGRKGKKTAMGAFMCDPKATEK